MKDEEQNKGENGKRNTSWLSQWLWGIQELFEF
jgi:hypothetical protein